MRLASVALLILTAPALAQEVEGDAERGQNLFQRQCTSCHAVDEPRNSAGPTLQGLMGRVAGSAEGFTYSSALQESGITWTEEALDAYLANPGALVRGTRMAVRVPNDAHRRDIIAYLAAQ
ncbi:cytochrome c family protein [Aquicoccus porphyridii]|uniref:Cytochrome c family protein n=1 Tax=Aquicoccus porphyridii TaxID=1852029 RepID=A0A5A9ZCS0_9RHOB|nr:cytochrome c family protein [Aquicoccus porphyridii]KAA0914876.1 cytochrome c family protein [Aquicoccus porphyridii]RAI52578.1 cytochrome c family protein [Rhodobacteraceae bacterium AsT-22]